MRGDYYRYIAEYASDNKHKQAAEKAFEAYNSAQQIATAHLETTNPIRLGLALNFSVFYYEVRNDPKQACQLDQVIFGQLVAQIEIQHPL